MLLLVKDIDFINYANGVLVPTENTTPTEPEGIPGDIDGDGSVGFADFLILSAAFGQNADPAGSGADIDKDGTVGFADFLILSANFGTAAAAADAALAEL